MKTGWLLFLGLILTFSLHAQTYKVISRNALNIRDKASTHSVVVGQLSSNDTVHVVQMTGQWAQITYNGQPAYISNQYIVPLRMGNKKSAEEFFQDLWNLFRQGPVKYLPLLIILTFLFTALGRRIFYTSSSAKAYIGTIGLIAICTTELFYFIAYDTGFPWFCAPDVVGWLWAIINFLLYGWVLLWQIKTGFSVIQEICRERTYNLKTGIYSYPIAIGLMIIFSWANIDMSGYIAWGLIIAQLVQIILNFYLIRHWGKALLVSFLFLLVSVAVIVSSFYFLAMLFVVIVGLLALSFMGKVAESSNQTVYIND